MKLLTLGNPKTAKGAGHGYLTAVLHLAPSDLSGIVNVCPRATAGCIAGCLNTAGRGGIFKAGESTNAIQQCRTRRTRFLVEDPAAFATALAGDVESLARAATRHGLRPALRLNGTSDLNWHDLDADLSRAWDRAGFSRAAQAGHSQCFREIVFYAADTLGARVYDYTKRTSLFDWYADHGFPVHLTFSRSETMANKRDARAMLKRGRNVAVVFDTRKGRALPATFEGVRVIDGDAHDLRFLDGAGVVVGLRAKGKARKDTTGFVVRLA